MVFFLQTVLKRIFKHGMGFVYVRAFMWTILIWHMVGTKGGLL